MALTTHVTDRYGTNSEFLRNLTNHDDKNATSVNTTRLALAATDAEALFPIHAGVAYDDTDAQHIQAAVLGVISILQRYSTAPGKASGSLSDYIDALKDIRRIDAGKYVAPATSSVLTPSTPSTTRGDVRPDFDRDQFRGVRPLAPRENSSGDD